MRGFLRGDANEQSAMMVAELQNGVRTRNEWRALLDLDPLGGGDTPLIPLNMGDGRKPPDPEPKPTKPPEPDPAGSPVNEEGPQ